MEIGDAVVYVDEHGKPHNALLTAVHGPGDIPSVNLVYVTDDETQRDPYGRQIARNTSVVHRDNQQAHGRYWNTL